MDCSLPCSSVRGLFRQEHCCHFPFQRIILTQGLNLHLPASSALAGGFFTTELPGKPVCRGIGETIIVRDQMKKSQLHFHYVSKYNVIEFCDQLQTRCFPCIEASRRCCTQGTSVCLAENLSNTLLFFFLIFNFYFILEFGEGNGNPLQCSCLENPRDRGAWWAAVYGVAQSLTGLK